MTNALNTKSAHTSSPVSELVTELRNPDFRGSMQHLRSSGEIDHLFQSAADRLTALEAENARKDDEITRLREAVHAIVDAKALSEVRRLVAGWNGEDREGGPFNYRHPDRLGATLPKTNCGAVYALDEALQHGRALLATLPTEPQGGDHGE